MVVNLAHSHPQSDVRRQSQEVSIIFPRALVGERTALCFLHSGGVEASAGGKRLTKQDSSLLQVELLSWK